jgi:hypothetical protein
VRGVAHQIEVRRSDDAFDVVVREGVGESRHEVTVSPDDLARLGAGYDSPEDFVRACFEFLLAREPKEAILARFDVSVIPRYFPEFEDEIPR